MKNRKISGTGTENFRYSDEIPDISPTELEELPEPFWRRPLLMIVGLFLIVLFLSLSFPDTLQGIVQSKTVIENKLNFPNATILFENNTLELLQEEFIDNEHREIKACLFGRNEGGLYYIEKIEFPEIIRANVIHVVSVPCSIDTLIDLHSHPINSCLASEQDISVYESLKQANPSLRMMVMCSSTRFALI